MTMRPNLLSSSNYSKWLLFEGLYFFFSIQKDFWAFNVCGL